jgi:glycosyltransferase involved in cell wall biosynthesis
LLRRVAAGQYPDKEVIANDGSGDATPQMLEAWADRTGLAHARGEVTIFQDTDLVYAPEDYPRLVEPTRSGTDEVVFGSRYLAPTRRLQWTRFRLGVMLFNGMVRVLYGQRRTDEATCYSVVHFRMIMDHLEANCLV